MTIYKNDSKWIFVLALIALLAIAIGCEEQNPVIAIDPDNHSICQKQ